MGKIKIGLIILGSMALVGLVVAGMVTAKNDSDNGKSSHQNFGGGGKAMARVMADTTSIIEKFNFNLKGCKILHELSDATALKCPADIISKLKVREDTIYYIMDMGANSQINADDVWALGYTGSGVTVAVLDTGIDTDHPELISSIVGGKGFGYATYEDDHGHGTHVSGIITADGLDTYAKGVAPDTLVWMAKVCDASGACYSSDIAAAIEYVVNNNIAKIMSISLGGGGTSRANCDTDYLAQKVNWAVDKGVTVAAAAGNTSGRVSSPGCASKAIAVGAVNKSDVRASWSGSGLALDIMAPGVGIYSSVIEGYASWSGTSMATPHISATVALLKQVNPALTDTQIKDALYKTAKDLGTSGWDKYYGWGRVDALGAVNYAKPPEPECTDNAGCDDSLYCNGAEICVAGVCQSGTPVDCSYLSDQCNDGVCNEATDSCVAQPKADGAICDDRLYCNVGEACQTGVCTGGIERDCSALSDQCNVGICNETIDTCETQPVENGTACNDGDSCTKDDFCSGGVCTGALVTECFGGDGCCPTGCSYATDTDCPAAQLCWSGTNQYLYRNNGQAKKFCKCAQGAYGYSSYTSKFARVVVYQYVDTRDNENWEATSRSSYLPVYRVTCTDGKVYPTNQDYSYPK